MADTNASAVNGTGIATKAKEVAALMAGKPYVWNGKTTDGSDCSGFVSYVFKQLFPNQASQFTMNVAMYITSPLFEDVTERQAGDIIIFPASGGAVNHIGIVLDSDFWVGSQSNGVNQVKFTNPYWNARPQKIRRLKAISTLAMALGRGQEYA